MGQITNKKLLWNPITSSINAVAVPPVEARLQFGDCILEATETDFLITTSKGKKFSFNDMIERLEQLETRYMEETLLGAKDGSGSEGK